MSDEFLPRKPANDKPELRHVNIKLEPDEYERVKVAAKKNGVSMREFARQALFFAMARMGSEAEAARNRE